jgi:hypothetical protein
MFLFHLQLAFNNLSFPLHHHPISLPLDIGKFHFLERILEKATPVF